MKFLSTAVLLTVLAIAHAQSWSYSSNSRVRRQGVKGQPQQQQDAYANAAVVGGARARPLPSRVKVVNQGSARQQTWSDQSSNEVVDEAVAEPAIYGSVAGQPGVDFPGYEQLPVTSFTCEGKPYEPGMYADEETQCQAYHVCFQGRKESFLCGVGTVFNQAILTCDYWHSVDCARSQEFYSVNEELGKFESKD